jgi:hypothetical protein
MIASAKPLPSTRQSPSGRGRFDDVGAACAPKRSMSGSMATVLLAYAFAVIMAGTTLPTPIYALYATTMHFTVLTTTGIYATYAGGCWRRW